MLYRRWNLREQDPEKAAVLAKATGAGQLLCSVLVARGIDTPEAVAALLAEGDSLPDPLTIRDMDRAVARIHTALENEEAIAVFGDYDVDGITSTALMYTYLESLGAEVYYKLPSRNDDDYGLSPTVVDQVADHGITLIITVDNGTTAFEAAERARERGVGLVVTDHHLPYDTLPEVDALVNPCRTDDDSGLEQLSGVGVAFMLLAALEGCPPEELLEVFGDLVAVGTVADVMKLTGHNRTIVRAGLAVMQDTRRPGLAALIRACGLGDKAITAENISYALAPRLNAAGRMDDATSALQLLLMILLDLALISLGRVPWLVLGTLALLAGVYFSFRRGMGFGHEACALMDSVKSVQSHGGPGSDQLDEKLLRRTWSRDRGVRGVLASALVPYAASCLYMMAALVPLRGDVRFHNVTFAYKPGQPVLHDISLYAKPGQKIALAEEGLVV